MFGTARFELSFLLSAPGVAHLSLPSAPHSSACTGSAVFLLDLTATGSMAAPRDVALSDFASVSLA